MRGHGDPLLEREEERAALVHALDGAREGGRLVWIEGPAGIGKTRLVGEARALAAQRGFTVLGARGGVLEREIPFGVSRQLFEPLLARATPDDRAELLRGPARRLASVFAFEDEEDGGLGARTPPEAAAELFGALFWLTVHLAARGPVLVAIDDAHWSDALSLRQASFLARRLDELPVCLLGATRTDEPGADEAVLAELALDPRAVVLRPRPLSREAVGRVVGSLPGGDDDALAAACHRVTGGNPFYVRELVGAMAADDRVPDATDVGALAPVGVVRSILLRLGRLSPQARGLAGAAAVLDDGTDLRVVARVAELEPAVAASAADELVQAAILAELRPLQFAHPIVRAAVAEDLTPAVRAAAHRRAADALRDAGVSADLVAAHLVRADPVGDDAAVRTLRRAADRALGRGDPAAAARLLERALAEPPSAEQEPDTLADLGVSLFHSAREAESAAALGRALPAIEDPARRSELRTLRAYARFSAEGAAAAAQDLAAAREDAHLAGDDAVLALDAELVAQAWLAPDGAVAVNGFLEGRDALSGGTPGEKLMLGLWTLDAVRARSAEEVRDAGRRAWADGRFLEELTSRPVAYYALVHALLWCEAPEVVDIVEAGIAESRARGTSWGAGGAFALRSFVRAARGELVAAESDAEAGVEFSVPSARNSAAAWRALLRLERGDVERAAREFAEEVSEPQTVWYLGPYARGRIALAEGRVEDAVRALEAVGARSAAVGGFGTSVPWRAYLALARHAAGDHDGARRTAAEDLAAARRLGAPGGVGRALRVGARVGPREDRAGKLEEACDALERSWCRLEHARARHDLGVALLRDGRRQEGRAALGDALDLARACGAEGLARRCHEELVVAGARPRPARDSGRDALTAAEARVAAMAAEGLTNREIAEALVVTPKTVENQLGAVYRKLGVSSRRDLRSLLGV